MRAPAAPLRSALALASLAFAAAACLAVPHAATAQEALERDPSGALDCRSLSTCNADAECSDRPGTGCFPVPFTGRTTTPERYCVAPMVTRFCCVGVSDCPVRADATPRCFGAMDGTVDRGLCVYADEPYILCAALVGPPRTEGQVLRDCFTPPPGEPIPAVGTVPFREGDCDRDGQVNGVDPCRCDPTNACGRTDGGAMTETDAGAVSETDAGAMSETDAGATPKPDGSAPTFDAAATRGPDFRGGGGCACRAAPARRRTTGTTRILPAALLGGRSSSPSVRVAAAPADAPPRPPMGYFPYYLAIAAISYGLRYPWLLAGAVAVYALRRFIPDPWVLLRTSGRIRGLRAQVAANLANVTARRDLAELLLARLRPRAALTLVDEALRREPANAELLFLRGVALARSGDAEGALGPLVECVQREPGLRYGEPYRVAGDALARLARDEAAEDAYERFVDANGSSIEGHLKLAQTRRRRGDRERGAARAARSARHLRAAPRAPSPPPARLVAPRAVRAALSMTQCVNPALRGSRRVPPRDRPRPAR